MLISRLTFAVAALIVSSAPPAADEGYLEYISSAPEFQPVDHSPQRLIGRWDTWLYMPWRYHWTIGTGEKGGQFCRDYGFRGGFTDHGEGPFDWLNEFHLRFYNDHTAAKGFLHLHGAQDKKNFARYQRDPLAIRSGTDGPQPLDEALRSRLREMMTKYVTNDQHGRGRAKGALDELFGVEHDGSETKGDFFGKRLWVETDQDRGFGYSRYAELFATVDCQLVEGYAQAERKISTQVVRRVDKGRAVYINLSPQRYLAYRQEQTATAERRKPFLQHIEAAGVKPWVTISDERGVRPANIEVTYWTKGDRMLVFVLANAEVSGSATGGGGVEGLAERRETLTVEFPAEVRDVVDERSGRRLGEGKQFRFDFNSATAVFFSFAGGQAR